MVITSTAHQSRVRPTQPPVAVHVFPAFQRKVSVRLLRAAARGALASGGADGATGVSVVVADDETIRSLNARHRGLDEVTDVLAFAWAHGGHWEGAVPRRAPDTADAFPIVARQTTSVGEVVLSYPQAARQAAQKGHSYQQEVALLVVHGVLHLLGHDHAEPADEAQMRELEAQALRLLGITRTLLEGGSRGG